MTNHAGTRFSRRSFLQASGAAATLGLAGCDQQTSRPPTPSREGFRHITVFRDKYRYVLGPSIAVTNEGDWLVAFSLGVMREVTERLPRAWKHPPSDPSYQNVITRSSDQGKTWDVPRVYPGYNWTSAECPGLAVLSDGTVLASVYIRQFYPAETGKKKMDQLLGAVSRDPYPWVSTHRGTFVHISSDGGRTWDDTVEVNTAPYISGYSPKGAAQLADGTVLLPLAPGDPFFDEYFGSRSIPGQAPMGNERDEAGNIVPARACPSWPFRRTADAPGRKPEKWRVTRVSTSSSRA